MNKNLAAILGAILTDSNKASHTMNPNIVRHFENFATDNNRFRTAQKINAAFLLALTGADDEYASDSRAFLNQVRNDPQWKELIQFYESSIKEIDRETDACLNEDESLNRKIANIALKLETGKERPTLEEITVRLQQVFFPEGAELWNEEARDEKIEALREKRRVRITRLNSRPITRPAREILFTSNILATIPPATENIFDLPIKEIFKSKLSTTIKEPQKYWYDHPIPVGISPARNEALYGLRGLDEMMRFEKEKASIGPEEKLTCLLSVSTTHDGLHAFIKEYFESELHKAGKLEHLNVYLFTENDTKEIVKEVLAPLAEIFFPERDGQTLQDIFGVDGEYGRHYTFLKAIAAFWQVFIDPGIKATFKIDLDQVFPQEELLEESGASALEHFKTPLWGAEAVDYWGNEIELGMIAGALVNQSDIGESLFTPDVRFPLRFEPQADEFIFYSRLPQALSTEAEMMTRYDTQAIDGEQSALQRIHVTGGTNGILIKTLRRHRPFTPTIIGRAEDQAYLLSVLFKQNPYLRYVHEPGLIMRHDKQAFAQEAIAAAETGKIIGDYVRILLYSNYARALPWPVNKIKEQIDPFTGCFVSQMPITVSFLRFAIKAASLFENNDLEKALDFMMMGSSRLASLLKFLGQDSCKFKDIYQKEQAAWELYYDILETAEAHSFKDARMISIREKALSIVDKCQIRVAGQVL